MTSLVYRILVSPIVFPMVNIGVLMVKLGNFIAWQRWETVSISDDVIW